MEMAIFNLKMAFGFLILFTSSTNFISGKPSAQPVSQNVNADLKKFVELIKNRISLGKEVAAYKWIEGEAVLDEAREKKVLESVKKTTEDMGFKFNPEDQLFFVELMEATKLLQYVLISNWNGAKKNDSTPKTAGDLNATRAKISGMQNELIKLLYGLKTIQNANDCQTTVAKAIGETGNPNDLLTLALQRAFGSYCKVTISHK